MASRVNTRFVVILAVLLGMVFVGLAGVYVVVQKRSGDRYVRMGDEAMGRGEINAACDFYSRAVAKERTNVAWLKKWRDALMKKVPDTDTKYLDDYRMLVTGVLGSLSKCQRNDVDAQCELLQATYAEREVGFGTSAQGWDYMIEQANECLSYFEPEKPLPIRRYRGLAVAGLTVVQAGKEVDSTKLEAGLKDLEDVFAADPKDTTVARDLMLMHRMAGGRAKSKGNDALCAAENEKARKVLSAAGAARPGDPQVLMLALMLEISDIDAFNLSESVSTQIQTVIRKLESLKPRIADIGEQMAKADPARLTIPTVSQFVVWARAIDKTQGLAIADQVVAQARKGAPQSADLCILHARVAAMQGKLEDAVARYEEVLKLTRAPVSVDGLRLTDFKRRAQFEETDLIVALAQAATDRDAAIDRAKKSRAKLAEMVADTSPELKFVDAKLSMVQGDLREAQRLFSDFIHNPGELPDQVDNARLLLADIALAIQPPSPGLARENLREVLNRHKDMNDVRLKLASVEIALDNLGAALELYRQVLDLDPQNQTAKDKYAMLKGDSTNPVEQVLLKAERKSRGTSSTLGDDRGAADDVEAALEANKYDPRLVYASVTLRLALNDRKAAEDVLKRAVQARPGEERLTQLLKRVQAADSVEATVALIDESPAAPVEKALTKVRLYGQYGMKESAAEALRQAVAAAPDDPRVLEFQFVDAIGRQDLDGATKFADRAAQKNADGAEGETFRARLQIARGNVREASELLDRAVQRGNANAAVYRLLGASLMSLGRGTEAVAAYKRAMELNPTDLQTVKAYMSVLVSTGQRPLALGIARESQGIGRRDPEYLNFWLALESDSGRAQFARERREELHASAPDDVPNALALADLYIRESAWDKARTLIDSIRAKHDSLDALALDAQWQAARGTASKGSDLFKDFIAKTTDKTAKLQAYVRFSQFLSQTGETDTSLAALRRAVEFQDPATMPVDLLIGDTLLNLGRYADAEQQFRKAIAAKVLDRQHVILKRLVQTLIAQNKLKEADAELAALGAAADEDVELLVQRAQVLREMGRARESRDAIDRAIARFPEDPFPYFQRARMELADPALASDAMADLGTAIKLRPTYWQALNVRAQVLWDQRKFDEAVKDLQAATDAPGAPDEARFVLLTWVLTLNRDSAAASIADAGIKANPGDLRYLAAIADRFASAGRWGAAAGYYKLMLAQAPTEENAALCMNAYLSATPADVASAESVLATPGLGVEKSWRLMVARARIRKLQGQTGPMRSDLITAYELCNDPQSFVGWFENMRRVVEKPTAAADLLGAVKMRPSFAEWFALSRAVVLLDDPPSRNAACAQLVSLGRDAADNNIKLNACKAASAAFAKDTKWEEAVSTTRLGLATAPDDYMLNNNLAYFLCENLKKPTEALSFAAKAFEKAPYEISVIDTMATVQWACGDRAKAIETLSTVLRLRRSDADKAPLLVKLARWKLEMGDKQGASALLSTLREMAGADASFPKETKDSIEKLRQDIEAAP